MYEEIKRWTRTRKFALVMEIIRGTTSVAEAIRQFNPEPSEIDQWVDDAKRCMENALKARPDDIPEKCDRHKELQEAYCNAMLDPRGVSFF